MGLQRNGGARAVQTWTGTSQVLEKAGAEDVSAPGRQTSVRTLGRMVNQTRRAEKQSGQKQWGPEKTKPGALSPGLQPPSSSGPNQKTATETTDSLDGPSMTYRLQTCKETLQPRTTRKKKTTNQRVLPDSLQSPST